MRTPTLDELTEIGPLARLKSQGWCYLSDLARIVGQTAPTIRIKHKAGLINTVRVQGRERVYLDEVIRILYEVQFDAKSRKFKGTRYVLSALGLDDDKLTIHDNGGTND
jgi:hypothetical protein